MKRAEYRMRAARLLFIAYFIVFAISPLSRPFSSPFNQEICSPTDSGASSDNLHVFLWEVFFSRLAQGHDAGQNHPQSRSRVFARSVRAILDDDPDERGLNHEDEALDESVVLPPYRISSNFQPADAACQPLRLFNSLYSGHSPPFSTSHS